MVRATLGALAARIILHCLPVYQLVETGSNAFVLGDVPRALAVGAVDKGGRPVTRLAAWLRVADASVATVADGRVQPLRPGTTEVRVDAGDHWMYATVSVYEPVHAFTELRPDQRFVATRVRLAPGGSVRYSLPVGVFVLSNLSSTDSLGADTRLGPTLTLAGPVACRAAFGSAGDHAECVVPALGATVTLAHPGAVAAEVVGTLALRRVGSRDVVSPPLFFGDDPAPARAVNPVTHTNWEGVGVAADVPVPAGEALETAQRLLRERPQP